MNIRSTQAYTVSQVMHQTMKVIFALAEVDLSVIKVFNKHLGPLFEVYIWERFIMPQEFSLSERSILNSGQYSWDTAL